MKEESRKTWSENIRDYGRPHGILEGATAERAPLFATFPKKAVDEAK